MSKMTNEMASLRRLLEQLSVTDEINPDLLLLLTEICEKLSVIEEKLDNARIVKFRQ